jgi:hypothetical protein
MKLELFQKQLENVKMCYAFPVIRFIGWNSVFSPNVRAVEMIDSLSEKFKMIFSDFCSYYANVIIFETPFPIDVSDASD